MSTIKIGTAKTVINNDIGTDIQAATHRKKVKYVATIWRQTPYGWKPAARGFC